MNMQQLSEAKELIDCLVAASITFGADLQNSEKLEKVTELTNELHKVLEATYEE